MPLAAGGAVTGQNFADEPIPGAITGVVYSDLNGDGGYDPGEPGLAERPGVSDAAGARPARRPTRAGSTRSWTCRPAPTP